VHVASVSASLSGQEQELEECVFVKVQHLSNHEWLAALIINSSITLINRNQVNDIVKNISFHFIFGCSELALHDYHGPMQELLAAGINS
jgi:hypothetical protein